MLPQLALHCIEMGLMACLVMAEPAGAFTAWHDAVGIQDCDCLVILTSGVPKLRKREMFKTMMMKLIGKQRMPKFYYDQMPEQVDWLGAKEQIDCAKEAGVNHIVLVGSMGVSPQKNTPDNTLNKIGDGNILVWKAKAEEYLMNSGVTYTIIHPGGLMNKPGNQRELVLSVNDYLRARAHTHTHAHTHTRTHRCWVSTIRCSMTSNSSGRRARFLART